MKTEFTYSEYLNALQANYAAGGKFNATPSWDNTETLVKLNKFYYVTEGEFILTVKDKEKRTTRNDTGKFKA